MEETLQVVGEMTDDQVIDTPDEAVGQTEGQEEPADVQEVEQGEDEQQASEPQDQSPMYTHEQMQAELDRVAERERARWDKRMEEQYGPYKQMANLIGQAAGVDPSDPNEINGVLRKLFEENGVEIKDEPTSLPQREQEILGEADAREDINAGIDDVLEQLSRYEQSPPQDFREIKRAQELAAFASQFFAAQELEKQGVKAQEVLGDKQFQKFASKYRPDVPITEIYADFKKMNGKQPKAPKSTGSVKGQGKTNETYFTQEQVMAMTREEIAKNLEAIERSQKNWYK